MPNSLKSHTETLREMFAVAANERRMKEADALASAIESLSRQGGEYDREMISDMLADLLYIADDAPLSRSSFSVAAINAQIELLRAAANRDAAGVHTGRASEAGDWVLVPRECTTEMELALSDALDSGDYSIGECLDQAIAAAPAPVVGDDARDAARYRWLRDVSVPPHNFYISVPVEFHDERYTPAQVDAAIDQAIESALTGANTQQNQSPTPPA